MHQINRIAPSTTGQALDQYYTKDQVVQHCLKMLGTIEQYDLVIEPSAGAGAFLSSIDHPNKVGIDIDPQHKNIIKYDFLKFHIDQNYEKVLVFGNPPYGRYHKLSRAFIQHAMLFPNVHTIGFILPNVYRKHTRQRIIPLDWRIVSITDLGRDCFTIDGQDYHVPTSFFVFDKSHGKDLRVVPPKNIIGTKDFLFSDENDFDVFVFGASPKRVIFNPKPNNRGYFLKSLIPVDTLVGRIKSVNWKGNSCATGGVYWLTKYEFWHQYKSCYESK